MAETLISPGVLARENDISFVIPAPVEGGAAFIGPAVKGPVEDPTPITSYAQYQKVFGTTFESGSNKYEFLTSLAVKSYFDQGGKTALVTRVVSGSFTTATSTTVTATTGSITNPFTIKTLGSGAIFNDSTGASDPGVENSDGSLKSGSVDNLRWEVSNINNSLGTFSLLVRRGDDNGKSKVILETFNNLSLDPNSDNYIEKVIGNQYRSKTVDADGSVYVNTVGDYVNRSRYIRVSNVGVKTYNYLDTDGITVRTDSTGTSYSASLPIAQSGSFYGASGMLYRSTVPGKFFESIDSTDTQGITAVNYADAISILGNPEEYQYKIISAPGLVYNIATHKTQLDSLISTVESRGDAIAVIDLVPYGTTVSNTVAAASGLNSSYAATYWPWVQMPSDTSKNVWAPASTVLPGVYAFTDESSAPWFAPAGLVLGGIPGVIQAERKLVRSQRDTLYSSNVNPIATFPGSGISVFGQKTLQKKASALDRVSVRRLLIELKDHIGKVARELVFQQNTVALRNSFLAQVNPYLDTVVQNQGLYAYRVVMDETNNTADTIDRHEIVGQIYIQPTQTGEFVLLDFNIDRTGATFGA